MSTRQPWEEAGFEFDEGDPSVGMWPGWVHWCRPDGAIDISEGWAFDHYTGEGSDRWACGSKSLVCNDCGANISWLEDEWDPIIEDEEPNGVTD